MKDHSTIKQWLMPTLLAACLPLACTIDALPNCEDGSGIERQAGKWVCSPRPAIARLNCSEGEVPHADGAGAWVCRSVAMGAQGETGPKGDDGAQGERGVPGQEGGRGAMGREGATGGKGDKGDPGAPGADGARGLQGEVGPAPSGNCLAGSAIRSLDANGSVVCEDTATRSEEAAPGSSLDSRLTNLESPVVAIYRAFVDRTYPGVSLDRVRLDDMVEDTHGAVSNQAGYYTFTVPPGRGGLYEIKHRVAFLDPRSGTPVQSLQTTIFGGTRLNTCAGRRLSFGNNSVYEAGLHAAYGSGVARLAAGDVVVFCVSLFETMPTATPTTVIGSGGNDWETFISIHRIGD